MILQDFEALRKKKPRAKKRKKGAKVGKEWLGGNKRGEEKKGLVA